MIRRRARYYDGTTSRARDIELALYADGSLQLRGDDVSLDLRLDGVRISPRLGSTPRVLTLPGGARCELADDDELARAFSAAGARGSLSRRGLDWLERHALAAVLAAVVTVALLAAFVQLGIPILARVAASSLPAEADARLGEGALAGLDGAVFSESELPPERQAELEALFASLAKGVEPEAQLTLRTGRGVGANAFALPGGTVVLTDELVGLAQNDDEICAVLAHELGHVAHRHALRSVLQNAGVGLLVATALGDVVSISSLAATLPTLLVQLQYSRRFEREADAYAVERLGRAGIPAEALASILERLEGEHAGGAFPAYLSTHPGTAERVRAIRQAEGRAV